MNAEKSHPTYIIGGYTCLEHTFHLTSLNPSFIGVKIAEKEVPKSQIIQNVILTNITVDVTRPNM